MGDGESAGIVECEGSVFCEDKVASKGVDDFAESNEGVVQGGEEDGAAFDKETEVAVRGFLEERAIDEGLYEGCDLFDDHGRFVARDQLVLTHDLELGLLEEVD